MRLEMGLFAALVAVALQTAACGSANSAGSAGSAGVASGTGGAVGSGGRDSTSGGSAAVDAATNSTGGKDAAVSGALDDFIRAKLEESHLPGVSAAVIRDGAVVWTGAYGEADLATHTPVSPNTLFEVASVSKTITLTALMEIWENGGFNLDDDVSTALPFSVRNPAAPSTPITFRQVLTHTASIKDSDILWTLSTEGSDCPIELGDFLAGYFTSGGNYYDAAQNFHAEYGPGEAYDYSNVGIALAGYLAQRLSGQPLYQHSRTHVLSPLGMNTSQWRLADLTGPVATPYEWTTGGFNAVPRYGYPDWPSGTFYTNAGELGRFLAAFIRGGELEGVRILAEDTVKEIRKVQFPAVESDQGLVWYYVEGGAYLGHSGSDWGWSSEMFFRVSDGVGVVVLTNGDRNLASAEAGLLDIETRLFTDATSL